MGNRQVCTALSRAPAGLAAPLVRVEAHLGPGLPAFFLVGLPETVVRESRERVRSAVLTAGFQFPVGRLTVNLSPADLPKEGGRFDLPIAVAILAASGQLPRATLSGREFYGELALGGDLRETPKLLPALIAGVTAGAEVILPAANEGEANLVGGPMLKLARHLGHVCSALLGGEPLPGARAAPASRSTPGPDLGDIRGQHGAKRALEIAASGGHGLLLIGPPGAGKTLLAQRLPGLLPALSDREALEVASIESAAGHRPSPGGRRPFRSPQHTASVAALIGSGPTRPGELSLAHLGVLFLDELPEFARNVLEALREPLESGEVVLSRARHRCQFPARFQLVAAMNPCPCGYLGDAHGRCRCTREQLSRYRNRLSGPLLDRIDMVIELAPLPAEVLLAASPAGAEPSASVAGRVLAARERQVGRQGKLNSRLMPPELEAHCELGRDSRDVLATVIERFGLSARGFHGVLRVARTCADLAREARIRRVDVLEAVRYRVLDRATC
ncbi:MAG: YifB family Mg chelatase-like AAA ATPase [Steroidobacteraceae bacterium]